MYESEENLAAEQEVAEAVCWAHGATEYRKLPRSYGLDYALLTRDGRVYAYMEVKVRTVPMAQIVAWGDYMLSASKWERGQTLCSSGGVHFILAVRTTDGLYEARWWAPETYPLWYGGRKDRSDPADEEPVVRIPIAKFKKLVCPPGTLSSPAVQEDPPVNQTDWTMR